MEKVKNIARISLSEITVLLFGTIIRVLCWAVISLVLIANVILSALLAIAKIQGFKDNFESGMRYFYAYVDKISR